MLISVFWLLFGALTLVLSMVHLLRSVCRKPGGVLLFSSLLSLSLTLLSGLWMIFQWTEKSDWSALMDVVPAMTVLASLFVLLIAALNLTALLLAHRAHPKKEVS